MNPRPDINPLLETLKTRRSVPVLAMQGPGPGPAEIESMLTVASRVPDHGKLAPWRFILFEGEARERAGAAIAAEFLRMNPDAAQAQVEIERNRFKHAPLVIGIVSKAAEHKKIPLWEQELSAGAVCMNLTTAAMALGYVTCWLTQWYAYNANVRSALGLAESERVAGFIHVGRHDGVLEDRPRPALADIVTRF